MSSRFRSDWERIDAEFADTIALDELLFNGLDVFRCVGSTVTSGPRYFADSDVLFDFVFALAIASNVRLDSLCPFAGGICGNGLYRWQVVLPPASACPILSIRRMRLFTTGLSDFAFGQEFGEYCKQRHHAVICAGATGSGKTTLLCALAKELATDLRMLILERIPEICGTPPNWLQLQSRSANIEGRGAISLSTLFEESLRLRPDGFIFGELRNDEDFLLFAHAARTGHQQVFATAHAGSTADLAERLRLLSGQHSPRLQLSTCIVERKSGSRIKEWGTLDIANGNVTPTH